MLVARFLDGLAGSAFLSVAGGTVGDMFSKTDLQLPMMVYTASPFIGPELGPLIGGFINQYTGWRWSFYTLLIWEGINLVLILAFIPETYHPVLLREKAKSERAQTGEPRYFAPIERMTKSIRSTVALSIFRPLQMLVLEPMCLNLCLFSAILLGVLYLFFGAFALIFETNHGFEQYQVGLSFLGLFVGMLLGVATDPIWHRNYQQLVRKREAAGGEPGGSEPEYRLPSAIVGAPLVTIGLFWFGWTTRASIHWIIPIIGSGVFALGILFIGKVLTTRRTLLVFSGVFTFLVDAYPLYAASAMAANSFARSSFAAAFPLFGIQMYQKLGYEWATSLLAFLTLVLAPFPYIFYKNGKRLREKSRFA
ncbi:MAG: hypothetical protein M1814_003167 [Vezdaea aestivalis]|nr:MAG: hypothetical protein M1814_003167 [Vezdaea aestivalis]